MLDFETFVLRQEQPVMSNYKHCQDPVSPKNDGFLMNFRDFGFNYYNGVNLKSGHLTLKSKI